MFRRVAWNMLKPELHVAHLDGVACLDMFVGKRLRPVLTAVTGTMNCRLIVQPCLQFSRPTHEVGMNVGFNDVFDMKIIGFRKSNEIFHISGGIDDGGLPAFLITNDVGSNGQSRHKALIKLHEAFLPSHRAKLF